MALSTITALTFGAIRCELLSRGDAFLGLGAISIHGQPIRQGALPMRPCTATHDGIEFDRYVLDGIEQQGERLTLRTRALGIGSSVAGVQDHSLDPVWNTRKWDGATLAEAQITWVLQAETRAIGGVTYTGFTYQYQYQGPEIYYLLDRATWELGGEATGITLLRQQMGTDPLVTLAEDTAYSTSGHIPFPLNPIMTHDVPRWASEQGFDYQYRGTQALIGLFAECGLIRTVIIRDAGDTGIRHFDKHIFDQTERAQTVAKFIGVAEIGDDVDHLNAWTRVFDADGDNVLGQFGMTRTSPRTTLSHNFWQNFTAESYLNDLVPAAAALGFQQVFIDPLWENDMTRMREGVLPAWNGGNMCCPHEYEVGNAVGGIDGYRMLAETARAQGVEIISWIGSHQSQHSPYLLQHLAEAIKGPDGRHLYGSGYDCIYGMDLASPFGPMFRDAAIRAVRATGISGYLYDSFFNFGWMPVNFHTPDPAEPTNPHKGTLKAHTMWRHLAEIMAAWQKAGVHMLIESLGPWGQPQHGVQGNYRIAGGALAYQCAVNIGYSVIPTAETNTGKAEVGPEFYFRLLAHKAPSTLGLWVDGPEGRKRIDQVASPLLRIANLAYRTVLPGMHTRTILHDDAGVRWHNRAGQPSAFFSLRAGTLSLPAGTPCTDLTTGTRGTTDTLKTEAWHIYQLG